jgi:hypothetical protein
MARLDRICVVASLSLAFLGRVGTPLLAADATLSQALRYVPIQPFVDYSKPTKEEAAQCTMRPEKENGSTSWIVRNAQGETLRRFADTNNDNVVDMWCYYLDGLEVYRDIDSNGNEKADQYRWFHMAGTRCGIDRNEDNRIDAWRTISPHEVAEQVVLSLKTSDQGRFSLLLPTPSELDELGLGKSRTDQVAAMIKTASERFNKLAAEQKLVTSESRYLDFGSSRPATVPAGTAGSTKDVMICDNATALVQTGSKTDQVFLGTLIRIGETWKLISLPTVGGENQMEAGSLFLAATATPGAASAIGGPTEEMQKLMAELEGLDRQVDGLSGDKLAENIEKRADLLVRLADGTPDEQQRDFWYQQLADVLSVAIQTGTYPRASERLDELEKRLVDDGANDKLLAHVVFQRMWAQYVAGQNQPDADTAKIQEKWLADLQDFVSKYPKSADAAEALLQLGMYQEFVGKTEEARKWYQQLVTNFPSAAPAAKAKGALRRLGSVGNSIRLQGRDFQGGTVDLAGSAYRGRAVLIHFWATWSDKCKEDIVLLKDFYAKKGGREFDIIGVCLDASPTAARQFLSQSRVPWKQIYEPGGVDGPLANELGVMTLPLMLLVDRTGRVVNNNIQVAELEAALERLQQASADTAGAARRNPPR